MFDLSPLSWTLLAVAAFLVGISKTAIPGVNTVSVALFASVLPAKASTGALLLLLIVGDIFALSVYRKHAHWPTLIRMVPAVLLGLVAGAGFLYFSPDAGVRFGIGLLLLLLMGITLFQRRKKSAGEQLSQQDAAPLRPFAATLFGSLGGFTTMVANAGGPVMSMYFWAARFPVHTFLGTTAWFFAVMNVLKLPFSLSLGIISLETLHLDALLLPAVLLGAVVGMKVARQISQLVFDRLVILMTILGAAYLLIQ